VRDPALAQQHGAAGRARVVSDFSLGAMVSNYLHLYRELMVEANQRVWHNRNR
jgi:hypothetical protein